MALSEIQAMLQSLVAQSELWLEASFARRAEALDELEFHVIDRLDDLRALAPSAALDELSQQATLLREQLEAVDQRLFQRLRAAIRGGQHTPASLRALLAAYAGLAEGSGDRAIATEYDSLDVLTEGLFLSLPEPLAPAAREPDMVYYQKTPARIIWELAAKLSAEDTFYDLGSGLGQVPLLVHLLSGAPARGVEIEPLYCRHAQTSAAALGLEQVQFLNADARAVDYADGTVFFLFTPFTGRIMEQVLERLRQVAAVKTVRVFSYGPGTAALTPPWLLRVDPPDSHCYQLAEFRSC